MHFGHLLWSGLSGFIFAVLVTYSPLQSIPAMVAYVIIASVGGFLATAKIGDLFLEGSERSRFASLGDSNE